MTVPRASRARWIDPSCTGCASGRRVTPGKKSIVIHPIASCSTKRCISVTPYLPVSGTMVLDTSILCTRDDKPPFAHRYGTLTYRCETDTFHTGWRDQASKGRDHGRVFPLHRQRRHRRNRLLYDTSRFQGRDAPCPGICRDLAGRHAHLSHETVSGRRRRRENALG